MIGSVRSESLNGAFLLPLLIALLLLAGGCTTLPAPPSHEVRQQFGHVAVVAVPSAPALEFHTFAKGWAAGAAKGGAAGMLEGLVNSLAETARNTPTGVYAEPAMLVTTIILTTVSTVVYGVSGGLHAVPGKAAQQIEQDLQATLGGIDMANDLAEAIQQDSAARTDLDRFAVTHLASPKPSGSINYASLATQGVDTLVETEITEAGFRGGSGSQPKVRFYLNARIRLRTSGDGRELYTRDFQYLSRERPFADWFASGSQALQTAFREGVDGLAGRVVDELFLVTKFPFDSGLWAMPGQPEFGTCWFRPLYPEYRFTSLWHSIRHNEPGISIIYTRVDSLQPELSWEPLPRPRDRTPQNEDVIGRISAVSYDLKIWEEEAGYPARLVLDVGGLDEPRYVPAIPLREKTKYLWTMRARYSLAGEPQVTRWAFSNIPSNSAEDYPQRQAGSTCDLDAIPSANYFRFETP